MCKLNDSRTQFANQLHFAIHEMYLYAAYLTLASVTQQFFSLCLTVMQYFSEDVSLISHTSTLIYEDSCVGIYLLQILYKLDTK